MDGLADELTAWIGRSETAHDVTRATPVRALDATLDHPALPAETAARSQRTVVPDEVLLFRSSALTFNGHRIHYDRRHAAEVEGDPGLVVQGPLIATLLRDLLRRHAADAEVATLRFKVVRPAFGGHASVVAVAPRPDDRSAHLGSHDHEGWRTTVAVATLR